MKGIMIFITAALVSALLLVGCGLTALAAEAEAGTGANTIATYDKAEVGATDTEAEIGVADTKAEIAREAAQGSGSEDSAAEAAAEDGNVFALLYEAVSERASEIASAVAAVASIVLAVCMRRGLTPMLKNALGSISAAVGKLREGVAEGEERARQASETLSERLSASEATVEQLSRAIAELQAMRSAEGEEQLMREDILTVMSAEVELLYDVFMSSALPQYKKDAVGERVAAMRKQLGYREGGDEA